MPLLDTHGWAYVALAHHYDDDKDSTKIHSGCSRGETARRLGHFSIVMNQPDASPLRHAPSISINPLGDQGLQVECLPHCRSYGGPIAHKKLMIKLQTLDRDASLANWNDTRKRLERFLSHAIYVSDMRLFNDEIVDWVLVKNSLTIDAAKVHIRLEASVASNYLHNLVRNLTRRSNMPSLADLRNGYVQDAMNAADHGQRTDMHQQLHQVARGHHALRTRVNQHGNRLGIVEQVQGQHGADLQQLQQDRNVDHAHLQQLQQDRDADHTRVEQVRQIQMQDHANMWELRQGHNPLFEMQQNMGRTLQAIIQAREGAAPPADDDEV